MKDLEPLEAAILDKVATKFQIGSGELLRKMINPPNPVQNRSDFLREVQRDIDRYGIAYIWTIRNEFKTPSEFWVIPDGWLCPLDGPIGYYEIRRPGATRDVRYTTTVSEVLEIRGKESPAPAIIHKLS